MSSEAHNERREGGGVRSAYAENPMLHTLLKMKRVIVNWYVYVYMREVTQEACWLTISRSLHQLGM